MNKNKVYLEALLNSDNKVITELYKINFPKVKSFVIKNSGRIEDAQDVFQKALMQIAVRYKVDKFEIKSSFEAYLFTVCKNLWRKELNSSKNRVTNHYIEEHTNENSQIAESIMVQKRWELFTEKLSEMSIKCKELLDFYFSKLSYALIVKQFNYNSEAVARQAVYKCKMKLKELIRKDIRYNLLSKS
ncbi:MAG: sigma-70 family RNA polymerase sigma factor [Winogradskyella sp.]|nr:MAG: sigma-70 family RNA polymerase sigma factor [Winogradskyella sp.]